MIAKNEKMIISPSKIFVLSLPSHFAFSAVILKNQLPTYTIFGNFTPSPISSFRNEEWEETMRMLLNHLIHFLIFGFGTVSSDASIQEFILFYLPFIFLEEKDTSLWILIVLSL